MSDDQDIRRELAPEQAPTQQVANPLVELMQELRRIAHIIDPADPARVYPPLSPENRIAMVGPRPTRHMLLIPVDGSEARISGQHNSLTIENPLTVAVFVSNCAGLVASVAAGNAPFSRVQIVQPGKAMTIPVAGARIYAAAAAGAPANSEIIVWCWPTVQPYGRF
jgi:hypothetical protein